MIRFSWLHKSFRNSKRGMSQELRQVFHPLHSCLKLSKMSHYGKTLKLQKVHCTILTNRDQVEKLDQHDKRTHVTIVTKYDYDTIVTNTFCHK